MPAGSARAGLFHEQWGGLNTHTPTRRHSVASTFLKKAATAEKIAPAKPDNQRASDASAPKANPRSPQPVYLPSSPWANRK
jgi:hypothetical protein